MVYWLAIRGRIYLEDYTKFRLKHETELIQLLDSKDDLLVISCNKCFKEYTTDEEPEPHEFMDLAERHGKPVVDSLKVDFLCNETLTARKLETAVAPGVKNIFVISCGLGVQTIAALTELPVYSACDSSGPSGQHGMALTKYLCSACGQCYLNLTGAICPVAGCSKSLVNGQCGGSAGGKCEVDGEKDCAWAKIYERLDSQDRAEILRSQPVQLRDYSKLNFRLINEYVRSARDKRFESYYGGLHPSTRKVSTEQLPIKRFPSPQSVVLPLDQHDGSTAKPIVSVGDQVKLGQMIGDAPGPVHASVSGTVAAVEPRRHPHTGRDVMSVVIEADGTDALHESVKPTEDWSSLTADEIVSIIHDKGIAGMGGAGFPTSVKLRPPKPIDTVLLNGCECEPLLTTDHRVMLEYADDIILGLNILLRATGAQKGIIAIEDNKPDAIRLLESKTADSANISITEVKTKYTQGSEKMLIKRALNRHVPSGALPFEVGVVVINVSTAKAVSDAIQKGMPLIERVVTVSGERIKRPGNYSIRLGTSVNDIIEHCGGLVGEDVTIKLGGPMMGFETTNLNVPIIKGTNGIIAIETPTSSPTQCIRCGRCVDVCPMELFPLNFPQYAGKSKWERMRDDAVMDCIECGCCDYICSSKISIIEAIKQGKEALRC